MKLVQSWRTRRDVGRSHIIFRGFATQPVVGLLPSASRGVKPQTKVKEPFDISKRASTSTTRIGPRAPWMEAADSPFLPRTRVEMIRPHGNDERRKWCVLPFADRPKSVPKDRMPARRHAAELSPGALLHRQISWRPAAPAQRRGSLPRRDDEALPSATGRSPSRFPPRPCRSSWLRTRPSGSPPGGRREEVRDRE